MFPASCSAWERHQVLMNSILAGLPVDLQEPLERAIETVIHNGQERDDQAIYQALVSELLLNPQSSVPFSSLASSPAQTGLDVFKGSAVDDPDQGMDQNLPTQTNPIYDPDHDQKWLGGSKGLGSQGFRHMYFGGWKIDHPIHTFQIPIRAVGQAPLRTEIIANKARNLLRSSEPRKVYWGFRVLAWAMHYVQDLAQPFHAVQIPDVRMIPWMSAVSWPPRQAFEQLVTESTRTIGNYHLAFENYVFYQMQLKDNSPFEDCLIQPEKYSRLQLPDFPSPSAPPSSLSFFPRQIALAVAQASVELSTQFGPSVMDFFGEALKQQSLHLALNPSALDYQSYAVRPDLLEARLKLHALTCQALANASLGTRALIQWAFIGKAGISP